MQNDDVKNLGSVRAEWNEWINAISEKLGCDAQGAYQALRSVLLATRDNLDVGEAADLGAQLPVLVRGVYYESFKPAKLPVTDRSQEQFLERVRAFLASDVEALPATMAVFELLRQKLSPGEADQVKSMLHAEVQDLWPKGFDRDMKGNNARAA